MQYSNCFKGLGYCLLIQFARSYLEEKLFMLCHCFLPYVTIALMHLFEIHIFHTVEAPAFPLTMLHYAVLQGTFLSTLDL